MGNENSKRGALPPVAEGKTQIFADGGHANHVFSHTGYPIVKKITLPAALQQEWQHASADGLNADFVGIFSKYETGRELLNTLKDVAAAKEGRCLGVHVVGLPKDDTGRDATMQLMQQAMGVVYYGYPTAMKPNLFDQDLHKDEGSLRGRSSLFATADAIMLYPKVMKENTIPTVIATNDEVLWAAARLEAGYRQSHPDHATLDLPPIDAPVEEKHDWLRSTLHAGNHMFYTHRERDGGVDYLDQHKPNASPMESAARNYVENLIREACKTHDFATPVYVQEGEALLLNNRAMYHARGEGPQNEISERVYMRAMVPRNMLPRDALQNADIGRY